MALSTFIALQKKQFGQKRIQTSLWVKKCHFAKIILAIIQKRLGWPWSMWSSKSNHRIWKILFAFGFYEYLERLEGTWKLESAYSFMLDYSEMTVWLNRHSNSPLITNPLSICTWFLTLLSLKFRVWRTGFFPCLY